jgi:hypothetical protein
MSTKQNPKTGKRSKKHGRWLRKPSYKRYLAEKRWLKNKARRIARIIRRHPNSKPQSFLNLSPEVKGIVDRLLNYRLGW